MNHEKEINKILNDNGIGVKIIYITQSFPNWDEDNLHNQYIIILKRDEKEMQFNFWSSVYHTQRHKAINVYDVVASLEWYELGTFEDFCFNFGYDTDSIKAFNAYTECQRQQKELFDIIPEEEIREKIRKIV